MSQSNETANQTVEDGTIPATITANNTKVSAQSNNNEDKAVPSTKKKKNKKKLTGQDLQDALLAVVEHCFSRENVPNDIQLLNNMDKQTMYVPIPALMTLAPIQTLTDNQEALVAAVRASKKVILDDQHNRVRPNHTVKRSTIILREVPEGSKEVDVRAMFTDLGNVVQCENEFGNIWFVRMDDEEKAKSAVAQLHAKGQKARLKSENVFRSYIGTAAPALTGGGDGNRSQSDKAGSLNNNPYTNRRTAPHVANPYAQVPGMYMPYVQGSTIPAFAGNIDNNHIKYIAHLQRQEQMMRMQQQFMPAHMGAGFMPMAPGVDMNDPKVRRQMQRMYREQYGGQRGTSRGRGARGGQFSGFNGQQHHGRRDKNSQTLQSERQGKNKRRERKEAAAAAARGVKMATPNFNSPEFPPLSSEQDFDRKDFPHRYAAKDIVHIIKSFPRQLLTRPLGMAQHAGSGLVLDTPYEEMVNKQRSLSMDEVDKALRHGEAIRVERAQSEDYSDLFYGNASHRNSGRRRNKARSQPVVDAQAPRGKGGQGSNNDKSNGTNESIDEGTSKGGGKGVPAGPWAAALARGGKGTNNTPGKNSKKKQAREAAAAAAAQTQLQTRAQSTSGSVSQKSTNGNKSNARTPTKGGANASNKNAVESPWAAAARGKASSASSGSGTSGSTTRKRTPMKEKKQSTPAKQKRAQQQKPKQQQHQQQQKHKQQQQKPQQQQKQKHKPQPTSTANSAATASSDTSSRTPKPAAVLRGRGWERPGTAPILPKPKPVPKASQAESEGNSRKDGSRRRRGGRHGSRNNNNSNNNNNNGKKVEQQRRPTASSSSQADRQETKATTGPSNSDNSSPASSPGRAPVASWGGKSSFAAVLKKDATAKKSAVQKISSENTLTNSKSTSNASTPSSSDQAAKPLSFANVAASKADATTLSDSARASMEAKQEELRVGRSDDNNWRRR